MSDDQKTVLPDGSYKALHERICAIIDKEARQIMLPGDWIRRAADLILIEVREHKTVG